MSARPQATAWRKTPQHALAARDMFGQRQQPQKPPPHGTMTTRSQAARRREKLRPDADIFKITVLGLAKTGKTSLCTQAVNHFFPEVYRHTPQTDSFITRVKVANGESRLDMVYTPQNDQRRSVRVGASQAVTVLLCVLGWGLLLHARSFYVTCCGLRQSDDHPRHVEYVLCGQGGPAKSNIPAYQLELQDTPGELWRKEGTNGLGSEVRTCCPARGGCHVGALGAFANNRFGPLRHLFCCNSQANRPLEHTPEHRFTTELSFHKYVDASIVGLQSINLEVMKFN